MNWKTVIIAICGISALVAIVHPSSFENPQPVATPAPAVKVKQTVVQQPAVKPDGYMSEADCAKLQPGLAVSDLMFKYGWPEGDYSFSNFAERFFYPVHDRGEDKCVVEFDNNKVVSSLYRDE